MKSIQQTRNEFFRLLADNGFESTGSADYDGNVIFAREWTRTCQVVWYGEHASTYRVTARISFGTPLIQLYENGRLLGQRDYSSPRRAMNAIREIVEQMQDAGLRADMRVNTGRAAVDVRISIPVFTGRK